MRIKHYLYNAFTISEGKTESKEVYLAGIRMMKKEMPAEVYSHGTVKLLYGLLRMSIPPMISILKVKWRKWELHVRF